MVRIASRVAVAVELAAVLFELRGCGGRCPEGGFAFLRWVGQVLVQAVPGLIRAVTMVATVWDKRA